MEIGNLVFQNVINVTRRDIPEDLSETRLVPIGPQVYQVRDKKEEAVFNVVVVDSDTIAIY